MASVATVSKQNDLYYRYSPFVKYEVAWFDLPEYNDERDSYIQTGIRPCVVVSNDECNKSRGDIITVIPITSSLSKIPLPTHYSINEFQARNIKLKKPSTFLAEGITSISKRRMIGKISVIGDEEIRANVDRVMLIQLGLAYLLQQNL